MVVNVSGRGDKDMGTLSARLGVTAVSAAPRLAARFARARAEKRAALVVYLTAGDPDGTTSLRLMRAAADAGADIIELGVPWSDPSADGPSIQAAMQRALGRGRRAAARARALRELRAACPDVPLVLFGYSNPILVMGADVFALKARDAGADGVLCVDYPPDEDRALSTALAREGLDFVPLLAPTSTTPASTWRSPPAGSFVYYVSLTGITGAALGRSRRAARGRGDPRARAAARSPSRSASASARRATRARSPLRRRGRRRQRRRRDRRARRRREARSRPRDGRLRPLAARGGRARG